MIINVCKVACNYSSSGYRSFLRDRGNGALGATYGGTMPARVRASLTERSFTIGVETMSELRTLHSFIETLSGRGDRPAMLALHKEEIEYWSYAELADHARRLARGLAERRVERGDHVALQAGNRPEWIAACLGAIWAGAVGVPLDVQMGDAMLAHTLGNSDAAYIFTTAEGADRLERLDTKRAPEPILLDAAEDDERSWRRLLSDVDAELPELEPEDTAALFYTSGTTGTAKGVPLSHGNLTFQLDTLLKANLVTEDDRVLLPLPLHHVYPFVIGMLTPLCAGLPIVMPHALTGRQLVRALNEGEVTLIVGVPRLYEALYSGIEERIKSGSRLGSRLFEAGVGLNVWLRQRTGLRIGEPLMHPLRERFGPNLQVLASGGAALPETGPEARLFGLASRRWLRADRDLTDPDAETARRGEACQCRAADSRRRDTPGPLGHTRRVGG